MGTDLFNKGDKTGAMSEFNMAIKLNPDNSEETQNRFKSLMGSGAMARFKYIPFDFNQSISRIRLYFPTRQ